MSKISICKTCGKYEDVCKCPKAPQKPVSIAPPKPPAQKAAPAKPKEQPPLAPARCCAVPSALSLAVEKNLGECRKMRSSADMTIRAMGTFGESMMLEVQKMLPQIEAQHNVVREPSRTHDTQQPET